MNTPFDFLYVGQDFCPEGQTSYRPPPRFEHGTWYPVVSLPYDPKNCADGYAVVIEECRMPARSYRIRALPGANSLNEPRPGFTLSTGSDMAALAWHIAQAVHEGMLDLEKEAL